MSTTHHHKVSSALRSFFSFSVPFKAYENTKIFHVFVPFCIHSCCLLSLKYNILPVETALWFRSTENNSSEKNQCWTMEERSLNGRDVPAFQNVRQITEGASVIKRAISSRGQWRVDVINWFFQKLLSCSTLWERLRQVNQIWHYQTSSHVSIRVMHSKIY